MGEKAAVVAAVDLSEISGAVLAAALRLARKAGGRCVVVHAVEALTGGEEAGPLLPALRRWVEQERTQAAAALDRLVAEAAEGSRELVEARCVEGRAFAGVLREVRARGAAWVVVGGPPPARNLGFTTERVLRKSPVPVLVIRRPPQEGYRRVLVGVDFSEPCAQALEAALQVAEPEAQVVACHVLHTWGLPRSAATDAARSSLESRLSEWVRARCPGRQVRFRVEIGAPKQVLLEVAAQEAPDLLAVGGRGASRVVPLLLGSVAEAAARRAVCDVLVAGAERPEFRLP
ncbi:MAG: universal stress protein [Deferrisomatales bacterium]